MYFKDLIKNNFWISIAPIFAEHYPDCNLDDHEEVFEKLKTLECFETDFSIRVTRDLDEFLKEDEPLFKEMAQELIDDGCENACSVDGVKNGEYYGIEFRPWEEWLGMEIQKESLEKFSEPEIIAHCICEMTYISLDPEEIKKAWENLVNMTYDIKDVTDKN